MLPRSTDRKYALATAITLALAAPLPALAASDYLLVIEGVKGESQVQVKGFENAIELMSWSWGMSESAKGEACVQDLHFVKALDSTTPTLIDAFDQGRTFASAKLAYVAPSPPGGELGIRFLIELGKVQLSSFQTGGSDGGGGPPNEQVSMNFGEASGFYRPPGGVNDDFMVIPGKCE